MEGQPNRESGRGSPLLAPEQANRSHPPSPRQESSFSVDQQRTRSPSPSPRALRDEWVEHNVLGASAVPGLEVPLARGDSFNSQSASLLGSSRLSGSPSLEISPRGGLSARSDRVDPFEADPTLWDMHDDLLLDVTLEQREMADSARLVRHPGETEQEWKVRMREQLHPVIQARIKLNKLRSNHANALGRIRGQRAERFRQAGLEFQRREEEEGRLRDIRKRIAFLPAIMDATTDRFFKEASARKEQLYNSCWCVHYRATEEAKRLGAAEARLAQISEVKRLRREEDLRASSGRTFQDDVRDMRLRMMDLLDQENSLAARSAALKRKRKQNGMAHQDRKAEAMLVRRLATLLGLPQPGPPGGKGGIGD